MNRLARSLAALALALGTATAATATDAPSRAAARVIVAFEADAPVLRARALSASTPVAEVRSEAARRAQALAAGAGVELAAGRLFGRRSMVVRAQGIDSRELAARLAGQPGVAYAVPDIRRRALRTPNDPLFSAGPAGGKGPAVGQWYLRTPDPLLRSAVNAQQAWDLVTGKPSIVVAVLDSGVLADHPDLAGRVLPGYDLIEDLDTANDGDGRDADATDPGDWITSAEDTNLRGPFFNCGASGSSWHGTQVAGIVGAAADDGIGMAGTAYGVRILPVRVLGKCGGYPSDIIAGMYWAAGIDQPGLPGSRTPARVMNLSLGNSEPCSRADADAVAAVTAAPHNVVVVAAAGNSTGHAVGAPANCAGVIGVAGLRHTGSKVGFSDIGPEVSIAAPGGNCVNTEAGTPCLYPILTTTNSGTRGPAADGATWSDSFEISVGTSFAAPIVAGAAALLLSARPELGPADVRRLLMRNARPFPTTGSDNGSNDPTPVPMCRRPDGIDQLQCYCTVGLCGAGMLDIAASTLDAVQGVSARDAASQFMDFAERQLPELFPGPSATLSSGPVSYRHYPATGTLLGVIVQSDACCQLQEVYVLGGAFGPEVRRVGRLTDFYTPRPLP